MGSCWIFKSDSKTINPIVKVPKDRKNVSIVESTENKYEEGFSPSKSKTFKHMGTISDLKHGDIRLDLDEEKEDDEDSIHKSEALSVRI